MKIDLNQEGMAEAVCFSLAFIFLVIGMIVMIISESINSIKSRKINK